MKKHLILSALLLLAAPASAQVGSGANITFGPNCSNSTAATAGNCVQRDANGNAFANIAVSNAASTVSAGGTTVLTAASAYGQSLTGSLAQTFQLPDARTLWIGPAFAFNNNSSQSLTITNAGGSTIYTVPAGGLVVVGPTDISTANGSWDARPQPPLTVTWGSGTTGLVMNSALNTTGAIGAGAASDTSPVFIPRRSDLTTGIGSQASGNISLVVGGAEKGRWTSTGLNNANIGATTPGTGVFSTLGIGGSTSSFPGLQPSGAIMQVVTADGGGFTTLQAGAITANGTLTTTGQLVVTAMTQTSAAQSGTVCYNAGTGAVTYDATVGCLASLEELKEIKSGGIKNAMSEIMALKPFWYTWKSGTPEARADKSEQPGLGAHATEKVDPRLVGYGPDGKLRGVRYAQVVAVLVAGMQEQQREILALALVALLEFAGIVLLLVRRESPGS